MATAPDRIHVLGASGSGTTTLGTAIADAYGHVHLDTDDYYWEPTDPPFQVTREPAARVEMLGAALDAHPRWVLTGSLCGWGDVFVPRFDLVIFLLAPTDVRLARLLERERRRFGAESLAPGGPMHAIHEAFMVWAAGYDDGGEDMRSRRQHEPWLSALRCPLIRLEEPGDVAEQMARLAHRLARASRHRSAGGATNVVTSTMTTTAANVDADRTG
jgi:adenylate kinase family enzyme